MRDRFRPPPTLPPPIDLLMMEKTDLVEMLQNRQASLVELTEEMNKLIAHDEANLQRLVTVEKRFAELSKIVADLRVATRAM